MGASEGNAIAGLWICAGVSWYYDGEWTSTYIMIGGVEIWANRLTQIGKGETPTQDHSFSDSQGVRADTT